MDMALMKYLCIVFYHLYGKLRLDHVTLQHKMVNHSEHEDSLTPIQVGWTPLMFAVVQCHVPVILLLLDRGANINQSDKVSDYPERVNMSALYAMSHSAIYLRSR